MEPNTSRVKRAILDDLQTKNLPLHFLKGITKDFSDECIIGSGAFGKVYKGTIQEGEVIAVKRLAENSPVPRDKAFYNEALNIMALDHVNIVKLVGYCHETVKQVVRHNGRYVIADIVECLLCYEYLPMGNVHKNLFDIPAGNINWETRFKIIKGVCQGLSFLHKIPIVHMDLKPENILLDDNMVPKIADFCLSRLFGQDETRQKTQNVVGSYGYIAPEYLYRGEISTQSDIYSLGLMMIEITTGERHVPHQNELSARQFIDRVRETWTEEYIASNSMYSSFKADCLQQVKTCIEIGLQCVELERRNRPSINVIVKKLNGS